MSNHPEAMAKTDQIIAQFLILLARGVLLEHPAGVRVHAASNQVVYLHCELQPGEDGEPRYQDMSIHGMTNFTVTPLVKFRERDFEGEWPPTKAEQEDLDAQRRIVLAGTGDVRSAVNAAIRNP